MIAYLYSLNPESVTVKIGSRSFPIAPADPVRRFSVLPIPDQTFSNDKGNNKFETVVQSGADVAKDLASNYRQHGVFWGLTPEPGDLESLLSQFGVICTELIREAASRWEDKHDRRQIDGVHRVAARFLNITTEWTDSGLGAPLKKCPDCAESIQSEAKVCKECGYRFDGPRPSAPVPPSSIRPAARVNAA